MKYSTPSIEVVTFNASDAPRIGMQWWVVIGRANWLPVENPGAYNLSVTLPTWEEIYTNTPGATSPVNCQTVGCTSVERLTCMAENIVHSGGTPRDLSTDMPSLPAGTNLVCDDGKSC